MSLMSRARAWPVFHFKALSKKWVKTERGNWRATVSREVFFRLFLVRRRLRTRDLKNRFTSASFSSSWSKPWKWKDCCFSSLDSFQLLFVKETLVRSLSWTQLSWYLLLKNSIPKGATQDTLMLLNQQVLVCISTRLIFFLWNFRPQLSEEQRCCLEKRTAPNCTQ